MSDYTEIADFILRITEEIWESKNIGLIYDCYSEDSPIHTLGGEVIGAEAVVRNPENEIREGLAEKDGGWYVVPGRVDKISYLLLVFLALNLIFLFAFEKFI